MSFRLRDHTADVAVEAEGETLGETFAAVAAGLTAAMAEDVPAGGDRFPLSVTAESPEAALFEYLDELIYQRDAREVLPTDHEVTVRPPADGGNDEHAGDASAEEDGRDASDREREGTWAVRASARGVPFGDVVARDVKAVTYSEMRLDRTDGGWTAYVVFDV